MSYAMLASVWLLLVLRSFVCYLSSEGTLPTLPESFAPGDDRARPSCPQLTTLPFSRKTDFPESVAQRDDGVDTAAAGVAGRPAPSRPDGRSFDKGKASCCCLAWTATTLTLALILHAVVMACACPLGLSSHFRLTYTGMQ